MDTDVGERLGEEGCIYCGGCIPVLDCFAGGGCCVWDSGVGWLDGGYSRTVLGGGIRTGHLDSRNHLHG